MSNSVVPMRAESGGNDGLVGSVYHLQAGRAVALSAWRLGRPQEFRARFDGLGMQSEPGGHKSLRDRGAGLGTREKVLYYGRMSQTVYWKWRW